jgi:hypothetical protein
MSAVASKSAVAWLSRRSSLIAGAVSWMPTGAPCRSKPARRTHAASPARLLADLCAQDVAQLAAAELQSGSFGGPGSAARSCDVGAVCGGARGGDGDSLLLGEGADKCQHGRGVAGRAGDDDLQGGAVRVVGGGPRPPRWSTEKARERRAPRADGLGMYLSWTLRIPGQVPLPRRCLTFVPVFAWRERAGFRRVPLAHLVRPQ